jgi:hypothetical protein
MLDWVRLAFASPYGDPLGLVGYLGVPIALSTMFALILPRQKGLTLIALFSSLITFFTIYIMLFGSSSTLPIGIMFALVPFGVVCAITVAVVRALQRGSKRH